MTGTAPGCRNSHHHVLDFFHILFRIHDILAVVQHGRDSRTIADTGLDIHNIDATLLIRPGLLRSTCGSAFNHSLLRAIDYFSPKV